MPRVSIGLPIYNGENYGEVAIQSILAQTGVDFELIIADNASVDGTEEICRRYAALDERIRYFRHERNLGAAHNFNFAFAEARGEYFKWASHDDVLAPGYLAGCVDVLDRQPGVVLAHARTGIIDDEGSLVSEYDFPLRIDAPESAARFRDLSVLRHDCYLIFGMIRHQVLARTPLIGNYVGSDRVLLCELALHGTFHELPEFLFLRRQHDDSSCFLPEREERVVWFDPSKAGVITYPNWRILQECGAAIRRVPQTAPARWRCHLQIPEQILVRRSFLWDDLVEGLKMTLRRSESGRRLFTFLKRTLKPNSVK
jgi:glycosyltransferase involved in cell wall biosynthesis